MRLLFTMVIGLVLLSGGFELALAVSSKDVQIFLIKGNPNSVARKLKKMTPEQGAKFVQQLRQKRVGSIRANESKHTAIFVINSSLPTGTKLVTQHQFERPVNSKLKRLSPYRFSYSVKKKQSVKPLVVLNLSKAGGRGGNLYYSLEVNGRRMKEVSVAIK